MANLSGITSIPSSPHAEDTQCRQILLLDESSLLNTRKSERKKICIIHNFFYYIAIVAFEVKKQRFTADELDWEKRCQKYMDDSFLHNLLHCCGNVGYGVVWNTIKDLNCCCCSKSNNRRRLRSRFGRLDPLLTWCIDCRRFASSSLAMKPRSWYWEWCYERYPPCSS